MKEIYSEWKNEKPGTNVFWEMKGTSIKVKPMEFRRLLASHGFGKYYMNSNVTLVKVDNNIVQSVTIPFIKDYVLNIINEIKESQLEDISRGDLIEAVINSGRIFTAGFLEFLPVINIEFLRDTKEKSFFFFRNGLLSITSEEIQLTDYLKTGGCFWKDHLIDRDFSPGSGKGIFEKFCRNVTGKDTTRFAALRSSIGYMLHRYKDPSIPKVVVYTDEQVTEDSYGRSGKGLTIKAISMLRKTVRIDGRNANTGKPFFLQRCGVDTSIIVLEDLRKNFPFNKLFSLITDGVAIEQKHKNESYLSYEDAPKFMISSNFVVPGLDDSTLGRQFTVEYAAHYKNGFTPKDEFGRLFFDEWDSEEWKRFDNFMVGCVRDYLKEGLQTYNFVNLGRKRFIAATSQEFAEFTDEKGRIIPGIKYNKADLYDGFIAEYPDLKNLRRNTFAGWLKVYAELNQMSHYESHSGNDRMIEFVIRGEENSNL